MLEVREDREHHSGDARLAASSPAVVEASIALETLVEEQCARPPCLRIAGRQTEVTEEQHRVGRRSPLWVVETAVGRQPSGPSAFRVLLGEQAGSPALARDLPPLPLDGAIRRSD